MTLAAEGHEIIFALDGNECMQKLNSRRIDLIILDVVMPGKNGFQLCREIKGNKQFGHIPIIMLTTKGQDSDKFWGMRQGADAYLVKPCQEQDLIRTVRQYTPVKKDADPAPANKMGQPARMVADSASTTDNYEVKSGEEATQAGKPSQISSGPITCLTDDRPAPLSEPGKKMFYSTLDSGDSFYVFGRRLDQGTAKEKVPEMTGISAVPLTQAWKSATGDLPALHGEEIKNKADTLRERLQNSFYRFSD